MLTEFCNNELENLDCMGNGLDKWLSNTHSKITRKLDIATNIKETNQYVKSIPDTCIHTRMRTHTSVLSTELT